MIRMLEISWFLLGIIALALGGYKLIADGFAEAVFYFVIMVVSFSMYFVRRKQRVKINKETGM